MGKRRLQRSLASLPLVSQSSSLVRPSPRPARKATPAASKAEGRDRRRAPQSKPLGSPRLRTSEERGTRAIKVESIDRSAFQFHWVDEQTNDTARLHRTARPRLGMAARRARAAFDPVDEGVNRICPHVWRRPLEQGERFKVRRLLPRLVSRLMIVLMVTTATLMIHMRLPLRESGPWLSCCLRRDDRARTRRLIRSHRRRAAGMSPKCSIQSIARS
jgi:hypothetical protein